MPEKLSEYKNVSWFVQKRSAQMIADFRYETLVTAIAKAQEEEREARQEYSEIIEELKLNEALAAKTGLIDIVKDLQQERILLTDTYNQIYKKPRFKRNLDGNLVQLSEPIP